MSKALFNNSRILRNFKACAAIASLALLPFAPPVGAASATPTAMEINKARAECAEQKRKVRTLESANAGEELQVAARLAWEHACGHAQELIGAASGVPPPKPTADPNAAATGAAAPAPAAEAPPPQ